MNKALTRSQKTKITSAKRLAEWLSIDISVKIFGVEIIAYHFPPEKKDDSDEK